MERYKLEIVNNDGDRYVRGEPAPDGSWVMFKDVEARIAELEAALRFYADDENWRRDRELDPSSGKFTGGPARAVIKKDRQP